MDNEIVRAWKDPLYRETLGQAPAHPAGIVELTDEELKRSSGMVSGVPLTTALGCTEYTFHNWKSCGCPSTTV